MEVWRGIGEGLDAVIVNPVIILGAGDWNNGSSAIFKSAYDEFPWYTSGVSGFVDVLDLVRAMKLLMENNISSERFIISGANLPYREVFNLMALNFHKKPPHRKVTPLLAGIIWRLEALKALFTGKEPLLTKETAKTASATVKFNNQKITLYFLNFEYTPIAESVKRICGELMKKYQC